MENIQTEQLSQKNIGGKKEWAQYLKWNTYVYLPSN